MRILIATHYWLPHRGGIETVAQAQAMRLAARGHQVTILTSRLKGDPAYEHQDGLLLHRLKAVNSLEKRGVPYPLFHPGLLPLAFRLIGNHDVVLAHSHVFMPCFLSAIISRLRGKPFLVLQHNPFVDYRFPLNLVERLADLLLGQMTLRLAHRILVISRATRRYVEALARGRKAEVLYDGVDTRVFRPAVPGERRGLRLRLGLPEESFIVFTLRRLTYRNAVDTLLEAAFLLRHTQAYFVVGGTGPDRPLLERFLKDKELSNCRLAGFIPDSLLPLYYQAADAFVLPSRTGEGLGMVVLEAMASGLPVVITRGGGQVELVSDGRSGLQVSPDSPGELASALSRLLQEVDLRRRLGEEARRVAEGLDWEGQVKRLESYLYEACHGVGGKSRG